MQEKHKEQNKINLAEMRNAVQRSGYLLEQRIFPLIESYGFYVETNPVYPDPITAKPREYDFSAITAYKVFRGERDFIYLSLIGECVNNTQPIVFFATETGIPFFRSQDVKMTGIPLKFIKKDGAVPLHGFFNIDKFHHYCKGRVCTQYCSFRQKDKKDNEWMAWHDDEHHALFGGLIEAVKFEMEDWFTHWSPPGKGEEEPVNVNLFYPLLIIRGDLFECRQRGGKITMSKRQHVIFKKSAISGRNQDNYYIDVMVERFLPKYLDMAHSEIETFKRLFQRRKRDLLRSIDRIVADVKVFKFKNKGKSFREILEF